ncbi:MBL fold metallo-hydrolase [Bacteroides sp. 51]|uniref:MBL fold metallo-hydrolase n=1 Tax=Bacteroides sp. 51 TaxID=2302938 RepID=UPI0013D2319F|nr:MBL fold metallo-hydrolase [Bacteroides sp. 51]NDV83137.1 MBL fold metallo-hydrolase [Bacteroides sp. 51]
MRNLLLSLIILFVAIYPGNRATAQESGSIVTIEVGDFEVSVLSEKLPDVTTDVLIGSKKDIVQKYYPEGAIPFVVNSFLVRTPDKIILIDTGAGQGLLSNLKKSDIEPEQIDIILLTHMHSDHIGGLLQDNETVFPNAALYIPQPEYDYWMNDEAMSLLPEDYQGNFIQAREIIKVYKNKLYLFTPDKLEGKASDLISGFKSYATCGHTHGHAAYLLESNQSSLLIWGDAIPAIDIQVPYPDVTLAFDSDPEQVIQTRTEIFEYVSKNNILIGGMHLGYPHMGKIEKNQNNYVFIPLNINISK